MLARKSYSREYLQSCRDRVDAQVLAYREVADAVKDSDAADASALAALEQAYFSNMVLTLDGYFQHRMRGMEGKDGNPANEVRVLTASILENGGILAADSTIALKPEASVLGLEVGDPVVVTEEKFMHLAFAYFSEIEARYGE